MGLFSFLGGLFGRGHDRRERERSQRYNDGVNRQQRKWFLADRSYDERYNARRLRDDRRYAEGLLADERDYVRGVTADNRRYDLERLADDRRYADGRLRDDRAYMARQRDADIAQYSRDRNFMQNRSNNLAERTAASRGIDFVKLRDDAIAAGYNPMTALSMAHAYSKQVDYTLQGGVYSPGANYTAAGPGYNVTGGSGGGAGGAAGGGVAPMSTPSSSVAAGGFQVRGNGYTSSGNSGLSSGAFIGEALDRAVDTYFNTPPERDPLADALRNIEDSYGVSLGVQQAQAPFSNFGYDLTKEKPFSPTLSVRIPPLRDQKKQLAPAKPVAAESPSDGSVVPSKAPLKVFGKDFKPQSGSSDASAAEDRYGEVAGELIGLSALGTDTFKAAYDAGASVKDAQNERSGRAAQKAGKRAYKINGKWYVQEDSVPISRKARDYITSGRTGSILMRNPKPTAGWMQRMYN